MYLPCNHFPNRPLVFPTHKFIATMNPPTLWCFGQEKTRAFFSNHIILFSHSTSVNIHGSLFCLMRLLCSHPTPIDDDNTYFGILPLHFMSTLVHHSHNKWSTLDLEKRNIISLSPNQPPLWLDNEKSSFS